MLDKKPPILTGKRGLQELAPYASVLMALDGNLPELEYVEDATSECPDHVHVFFCDRANNGVDDDGDECPTWYPTVVGSLDEVEHALKMARIIAAAPFN